MTKPAELIGKKFGRLTVVSEYGRNKAMNVVWLCSCDCGNCTTVTTALLNTGNTRSCGCLQKDFYKNNTMEKGSAMAHRVYRRYKRNADSGNRNFSIAYEDFLLVVKKNCYYCNNPPSNTANDPGCNGEFIYNGIDRVDNTKGYIIDNIVPCCGPCNVAKNNMSLEQFKDLITRIYNNGFHN